MLRKTDSEIEQWVLRELRSNSDVQSKELCVFCCDGVVTLAGTVDDQKDKLAAETGAHRAPHVLDVVNLIAIKPSMALIEQRFVPLPLSPPASAAAISAARTQPQPIGTGQHA